MNFSVTRNGKDINSNLYLWDEENRVFSTKEDDLVIDFGYENYIMFKTGSNCKFKTGNHCVFNTGGSCKFKTGNHCVFNTVGSCIFNTGGSCIFKTGNHCVFNTGGSCIFNTGGSCIFETGNHCVFKTNSNSLFKTGYFCVIIRKDVFEIIQPEPKKTIKLNKWGVPGYKIEEKHKIVIDGKEIELSEESYQNLKKQLI